MWIPDFSSLYTTNAGEYTATVQAALKTSHAVSSFEYMDRIQQEIAAQYPGLRTFFTSGLDGGCRSQSWHARRLSTFRSPAPICIPAYRVARDMAERIRGFEGVSEAYIPQDMDYPAVRLDVDRVHAAELGLAPEDVVSNVITALNSDLMIAPNYWLDRKTGNDYFLTVQYYEHGRAAIHNFVDLRNIPLRGPEQQPANDARHSDEAGPSFRRPRK